MSVRTARTVALGALVGAAVVLSTAATTDTDPAPMTDPAPTTDVALTDAPTEPVGSAPTTVVAAPTTDPTTTDPTTTDPAPDPAPVIVAAPTTTDPAPVVAAPTADEVPVIEEDDPRWDCRVNGNQQCGFTVQGTTYVVTFVDGQPTTVTTR